MTDTPSPLATPSPDSLASIFDADPRPQTAEELAAFDRAVREGIVELQRRRNVFAAEEAAKSLAPKKTRSKAEAQPAAKAAALDKPTTEVTLDDLD